MISRLITIFRIILAINIGVGWLFLWTSAALIFFGKVRGSDETALTLFVAGLIGMWLARLLYPNGAIRAALARRSGGRAPDAPPEYAPPEYAPEDDEDWQVDIPAEIQPRPTGPKLSADHDDILRSLRTSHQQRKASKTYENIDQIPGSTNQLIDEGRELLDRNIKIRPEDDDAALNARRMIKISRKLALEARKMSLKLKRTDHVGQNDQERYLTLIDEIEDLAADLGFEARRLLDLDEQPDW